MPFYEERVLPRLIDVVLGGPFQKTRARVAGGLSGQVLEIGFGSGRNIPHYPDAVNHVWAVDPSTIAREIAAKRLASSTVPIDFIGLDGQQLSLPDAVADHVLVTWTLCTIPDVASALREMHRVLSPGGELHFVEHGRAADPRMARWQDHLTPAWKKISGGCHLNRPIPDIIAASGLVLEASRHIPSLGPDHSATCSKASHPSHLRSTEVRVGHDRSTSVLRNDCVMTHMWSRKLTPWRSGVSNAGPVRHDVDCGT